MSAKIIRLDKFRHSKTVSTWIPSSTSKLDLSLSKIKSLIDEIDRIIQQEEKYVNKSTEKS